MLGRSTFVTVVSLTLLLVCGKAGSEAFHFTSEAALPADSSYAVPSVFESGRIFVTPVTTEGDTLRFFTDTGGGLFILDSAAEQLSLAIVDTAMIEGRPTPLVVPPAFRDEDTIPTIPGDAIPAFPSGGQAALLDVGDGLLGQAWFGDRVWTFDYGDEALWNHPSSEGLPEHSDHAVPLGFRTDEEGRRVNSFPSIEATIDGETYAFLFDTGASLVLTESAHAELGGPRVQGTSFIVASIFEQWRSDHPDWRVIENAEDFRGNMPIIEVPAVTVAGHTVGPVWFTKRPDANFHEFMSSMMDRRVDGALGGSAFKYFRILVDYPNALAVFERVDRQR